jgi:hypothetical protein
MLKQIAGIMCGSVLIVGCASNSAHKEDSALCDMPGMGTATKTETAEVKTKAQNMVVYGGTQKLTDAQAVPASKVLANASDYDKKYVRLVGKVSSVCEKKGCWLRVVSEQPNATADNDIFIKFQDPPEGRLIPMEAIGKKVVVEGTFKIGQMSEAQARHFKEDSGASQEELAKIVGPQKQFTIAGPVVAIEGVQKSQ